jgi:pyruvate/2-oxoglutarate/acetoin dehydrogenase E1 component/TPP-dependent pyruvate/acetoin dehydrogenase alpha subunit
MEEVLSQQLDYRDLGLSEEEILADYRLGWESREASILGRKEVLTGKAKFGIFGDGKEVAQLALAKVVQPGDIRAGYYRDQTLIFATGMGTIRQFFAQLYADLDLTREPFSGGRQMNAHFGTRFLTMEGNWKNLTTAPQSAIDLSPTGSQMAKMLGLGLASKFYRHYPEFQSFAELFSNRGNEIVIGTIGDASTSEGIFWEALNAAGVLQIPLLLSVWDDHYGISVPIDYQTVKKSISKAAAGFQTEEESDSGIEIYAVKGWDYLALVYTYRKAAEKVRKTHRPALVHVYELTQPQGHSTSGSHERYKPRERLEWEREYDCLKKMREWILLTGIATEKQLDELEREAKAFVHQEQKAAWNAYIEAIRKEGNELVQIIHELAPHTRNQKFLISLATQLSESRELTRKQIAETALRCQIYSADAIQSPAFHKLRAWKSRFKGLNYERYSSYLYSENPSSPLYVEPIPVEYDPNPEMVPGYQILNRFFDIVLARDPRVVAFGEDVGRLGDVNQAFAGLQAKYGEHRVFDTGIREATIVGQAIGLALRGFRPIAEIQYLDYLLYALQILSDDVATLRWRSKNGQKAPIIVRTRGHRLEGVWHSGSLMAGIIHLVRGMHVLVPRNMTQAAGLYNTILHGDDPAIMVEVLNGYRLREPLPKNLGEYTIPLGVPEILRTGSDVTLVTYGACCRIVMEAAQILSELGIDAEVIDVRTLLPFDIRHMIKESLEKTNRIVFIDEDVPGGTTAYMMQQVLEEQGGYYYLDSPPVTIPGKAHRPAYGTDGDYFSKPNVEEIVEVVYQLFHELDPATYPEIF